MKYIKILRPWQLVKNFIIFIPLVLTSESFELFFVTFEAFVYFSLLVSGTYVVNDLIDYESDRTHPTKKNRPIASEDIDKRSARIYSTILIFLGLALLFNLNFQVFILSLIYLISTIFYSVYGKNITYIDTTLISIFFLIRLFIGGYVINAKISIALALFLYFTSFSIALAKKISILSDNNIANENITKIKLQKRYSLDTLINLIYYSSALSVVTLIIWLTTTKYIYFDNLQVLSLFISIIFYSIFSIYLVEESKNGKMEDFVIGIIKNRHMSILLFLTVTMFILGYLT